jgi:lipopolysaccharide export system permease protein
MALPFSLGLALFTFVLLLARLLKLIELVVNRGLPAGHVLRLLAYLLPQFLEVTVPMAMLLAILVAFGRLSSDSEIVALRSSGLSLYQLTPPVTTLVVLVMVVTGGLAVWGRPWGNRALRLALFDTARSHATAGLRPQVFNDDFPGLVIYAEGVEPAEQRLRHVLISDQRDPSQQNTVFAREGQMLSDAERDTMTLRLSHGAIHTVDLTGRAHYRTEFESYDVNLDLEEALGGLRDGAGDPHELTLAQLRQSIATQIAQGDDALLERIEYHRKFSIPFACVVFGLIGMPLGIQRGRAVRSRGFAIAITVIFAYYGLLSAGQALAEQGTLTPAVGLWLPNVVLGSLGLVLFHRSATETPMVPRLRRAAPS